MHNDLLQGKTKQAFIMNRYTGKMITRNKGKDKGTSADKEAGKKEREGELLNRKTRDTHT